MKIAVWGATEGTGQQFVKQALATGQTVTALLRTLPKMTAAASSAV